MFPHEFIILVTFNFETFTVNIIFILSIFIKNNIYCQLERLIQHSRDKRPQKRRRLFNTRVSIDLYQPSIEVLIQNKVIPKYLKAMFPLLIHYRIPDRIQGYPNILFNFFDNCGEWKRLINPLQIIHKIFKGQLIAELKLLVLFTVFLYRVISEMNELILHWIFIASVLLTTTS